MKIGVIVVLVVSSVLVVVLGMRDSSVQKGASFEYESSEGVSHSIELDQILDGGPGKDGIPALTNPEFTTIENADESIDDTVHGILVIVGNDVRYYPYNILVWHEIVNDVVGGAPLIVTFCPLCGSAIVYESTINKKVEQFGVSGKLYNSNLLMYDKTTESLWSQIEGAAVVGKMTGTKLKLYPSQVVSFRVLRDKFPQARVLSARTGHIRDYARSPYSNYNDTDSLYFPVEIDDTRLPKKEIMYVVNFNNRSVAFKLSDLKPQNPATVDVEGMRLTVTLNNGLIEARDDQGVVYPSYHSMWFVWAAYHQKDGIVWTASGQR